LTRGANFSSEELDSLLELIEEVLPISATQWESVADLHRTRYPDAARTVDSIRRKFKQLHNKKIPTGNPICPPAVRWAKRLRTAIIELMDSSDINGEDDDPPEDDPPDDSEHSSDSSSDDLDDLDAETPTTVGGLIIPASVTTRPIMDPASRLAAIVARRGNVAGRRAAAARSSNSGVEGDDGDNGNGEDVDGEQGGAGQARLSQPPSRSGSISLRGGRGGGNAGRRGSRECSSLSGSAPNRENNVQCNEEQHSQDN